MVNDMDAMNAISKFMGALGQGIGACSVGILLVSAAQAADFIPLGDLPGGEFHSNANGISADGSVVVGWSGGASGDEAPFF